MRYSAGTRLGPYEILEPIGAGGMGEVYRARDARLDRTVAIKILSTESVVDAERRRRFLQEARTASALNNAHIVSVFDVGVESGCDFLVMEFVSGHSLDRLIPARGLPLTEALSYAEQIADALAAAHAAGIVRAKGQLPAPWLTCLPSMWPRIPSITALHAILHEEAGSIEPPSRSHATMPLFDRARQNADIVIIEPKQ